MKKTASPVQTEKRAKRTPEEKAARKATKSASRASAELDGDRVSKKASQKKSLKSAAKQLQKELNSRMNEVVTRIRKETKAKLKEVVKEATRRLDGDMEPMFALALQTIVKHYDTTVSGALAADQTGTAPTANGKGTRSSKKSQTLNKDGSPRKSRAANDASVAATASAPAPKAASRTAGTAAKAAPATAKRGRPATAPAPVTGAKRGPKPRVAAAPEANNVLNSADSPGTGEVSA